MKFFVKHGERPPVCALGKFEPTLTDASFEKECKIDRIIYKYTHNLPLENYQRMQAGMQYMDVTKMPTDPEQITEFMEAVNEQFMRVPAEIRREYGDNAWAFAQAVSAQDFEKSDAAKKLDEAIRKASVKLNPTLEEMLRRSKEQQAELIASLKEGVQK